MWDRLTVLAIVLLIVVLANQRAYGRQTTVQSQASRWQLTVGIQAGNVAPVIWLIVRNKSDSLQMICVRDIEVENPELTFAAGAVHGCDSDDAFTAVLAGESAVLRRQLPSSVHFAATETLRATASAFAKMVGSDSIGPFTLVHSGSVTAAERLFLRLSHKK